MSGERPVPLFVPPELAPQAAVPVPLPVLPEPRSAPDGLLLGVATVDHSGRVGDRLLMAALAWRPGDRTDLDVLPGAVVLHRRPHGRFRVDGRGHVFLPAAIRTLLGVPVGGRVVLLAAPARDLLVIHAPGVVTALLAARYPTTIGAPDGR